MTGRQGPDRQKQTRRSRVASRLGSAWRLAGAVGLIAFMLAVPALLVSTVSAQTDSVGLTGPTRAGDMVQARQLLMSAIEAEMMEIDGVVLGKPARLEVITGRAYAINTMMTAFPHLFAPQTRPDAASTDWPSPTSALPAVWETFPAFYDLVQASAAIAFDASQAGDIDTFRARGAALRAACDSCHATYMGSN